MRTIAPGAVDQSVVIRIVDATDGTPETGVVAATAGLALSYRRELDSPAALTESDLAAITSAHADGGLKHIGAGYYRVDVPDAAFAAGVPGVLIFGEVTGMVVIGEYVQLETPQTGDSFARLGAPAGASVSADVAAVKVDTAAILVDTGTTLQAEVDGIQADTEDLQARLPAALVGGRIDASVGAMAAGVVTAAAVATDAIDADALAADAVAEIAAGVSGTSVLEVIGFGEYGDADPDDTVDVKFITVRAGTLTTLAGTPVVSVYRDNSLVEIAAGVTLTVDFDGRTGVHHVRIDTGADAAYIAGSNYQVVLTAGTVGGDSVVNRPLGSFSLHYRAALRPSTPKQTVDVDATGAVTPTVIPPTAIQIADEVETRTVAAVALVNDKTGYELSATGVDAILDTAIAEPEGVFAWGSATLRTIVAWLGARASNTQTQTATTTTVRNRADDATIATSTSSDDGTTGTRGSFS